ncbi:TPA: type VI secretion system-associated protein TagO [Vibrio parahaemolyticus]
MGRSSFLMRSAITLGLTCVSANALAMSLSPAQMRSLFQCRDVTERLERLACFDEVMKTPLRVTGDREAVHYPTLWRQVWQASKTQTASPFLQHDEKGNVWLAVVNHSQPSEQAVLVLSCIDKLSRVEVLFAHPLAAPTVNLTLSASQEVVLRSDDFGVMYSFARGLPAIDVMKNIGEQDAISLTGADNLGVMSFDTQTVSTLLPALQQRCRW